MKQSISYPNITLGSTIHPGTYALESRIVWAKGTVKTNSSGVFGTQAVLFYSVLFITANIQNKKKNRIGQKSVHERYSWVQLYVPLHLITFTHRLFIWNIAKGRFRSYFRRELLGYNVNSYLTRITQINSLGISWQFCKEYIQPPSN